jgi:hypothetical protein
MPALRWILVFALALVVGAGCVAGGETIESMDSPPSPDGKEDGPGDGETVVLAPEDFPDYSAPLDQLQAEQWRFRIHRAVDFQGVQVNGLLSSGRFADGHPLHDDGDGCSLAVAESDSLHAVVARTDWYEIESVAGPILSGGFGTSLGWIMGVEPHAGQPPLRAIVCDFGIGSLAQIADAFNDERTGARVLFGRVADSETLGDPGAP